MCPTNSHFDGFPGDAEIVGGHHIFKSQLFPDSRLGTGFSMSLMKSLGWPWFQVIFENHSSSTTEQILLLRSFTFTKHLSRCEGRDDNFIGFSEDLLIKWGLIYC